MLVEEALIDIMMVTHQILLLTILSAWKFLGITVIKLSFLFVMMEKKVVTGMYAKDSNRLVFIDECLIESKLISNAMRERYYLS